jgi:hypothetical protein
VLPEPHVINPTAVYRLGDVQVLLGLGKTTAVREIRARRLRVAKRAGRYFILGDWLLEWIRAGELRRREPAGLAERNGRA